MIAVLHGKYSIKLTYFSRENNAQRIQLPVYKIARHLLAVNNVMTKTALNQLRLMMIIGTH